MLTSFETRSLTTLTTLAALALPALASAQFGVVVVDDDGGGDFTALQAAVDGAGDGDVVLVRAGQYDGFTVTSKSLVITADTGQLVEVRSPITVQDLQSSQEVQLRGLRALRFSPSQTATLLLQNDAGEVWVEDCALGVTFLLENQAPGAIVQGCQAVTFLRCDIRGTAQFPSFGAAGQAGPDGVLASDSNVSFYDTEVRGGPGTDFGRPGGAAAIAVGGSLFASGSLFVGGDGAAGGKASNAAPCLDGGDGGAGLLMGSPGPTVRVLDTQLLGGLGGPALTQLCPAAPGQPGSGIDQLAGSFQTIAGQARSLALESPVRQGQNAIVTISGHVNGLEPPPILGGGSSAVTVNPIF